MPCACWLWTAFVVSGLGVAGSLLLTWANGLPACPLCVYQRVFSMTAFATLAMGLLVSDVKPGRASLFALPSLMAGFAVAIFHVNLVAAGKLAWFAGLADLGSAPLQSLVLFMVLLALLGADLIQARRAGHAVPGITLGASVLGVLMAIGLIYSGPPLPAYQQANMPSTTAKDR